MRTQRAIWLVAILVAIISAGTTASWGAETTIPLTLAKRAEFYNGYHDWSPRQRREALKLLLTPEYRDLPDVGATLSDIALFDKDPENRRDAFVALCSWTDLDGRLAYHLARTFKLELEPSIKPRMAQAATQLKFKTDILNTLIVYTSSPGVDPYHWGGWWGWGSGYDSRTRNQSTDAWGHGGTVWDNYRMLVDSINRISGQRFGTHADTTRQMFKWWHYNAIDFQADDVRLAQKLKTEANQPKVQAVFEAAPDKPWGATVVGMLDRKEKDLARDTKVAGKKVESKKEPAKTPPVNEDELE